MSTDYHMALPIDFALLMTKEGDKVYLLYIYFSLIYGQI